MKLTTIWILCFWMLFVAIGIRVMSIEKELKILNKTLVQINYAIIEQNTILKFDPMDEKRNV